MFKSIQICCILLIVAMFSGCGGSIKNIQVQNVEVCKQNSCDNVAKEDSIDLLKETFYRLLEENKAQNITVCEADMKTKKCTEDSISHFVQGGPIPGLRVIKNFTLGDTVLIDRTNNKITFNKKHYGTFIGVSTYAPPYSATISVDGNNTIIWDEEFYQSWMVSRSDG
jgi:hypothetical protein